MDPGHDPRGPFRGEVPLRHFLLHAPAVGQTVLHHPVFHRIDPRQRNDVGVARPLRRGVERAAAAVNPSGATSRRGGREWGGR